LLAGSAVLALPVWAAPAKAATPVEPVTIAVSHRLDEVQAERLEPLVDKFNAQHKDVQVTLVRRAEGDAPRQINLVTRDEYARFMEHKASFKPLHQVMRDAKVSLDSSKLAHELRDSLVDRKGQWYALPVAFSTPVL
jgi:sn-glycerol 3-phosphate transport system substrate-binding protein